MLAQPYNPHLFRQGVLLGPQMLLDVLLGRRSRTDVKAAWKQHEQEAKAKAKESTTGWERCTLPCRVCTDNNAIAQEVWLPMTRFADPVEIEDMKTLERLLSRGQDLVSRKPCIHVCMLLGFILHAGSRLGWLEAGGSRGARGDGGREGGLGSVNISEHPVNIQ